MSEQKHIISEIENMINSINQTSIESIKIDSESIEKQLKILEGMIYSKPINIIASNHILIPVKTQEKCKLCQRTAMYMEKDVNQTFLCWIHSLNQ